MFHITLIFWDVMIHVVPEDGYSASPHTHTRHHVPQDRDHDIHRCANLVPNVYSANAAFTDTSS